MNQRSHNAAIFASTPLEHVREGMSVLDADGKQLGTVAHLHMGDPQAATTAGNEPMTSGADALSSIWRTDVEEFGDVPDVLRAELRRAGYIEVDGSALEGANRFIPGDRIAEVSSGTVRLRPLAPETTAPVESSPTSTTSLAAPPPPDVVQQPTQPVIVARLRRSYRVLPAPRWSILVAAGVPLVLGGAGLASWCYLRWRREHDRPVNRVRRAMSRAGDRLVNDYPLVSSVVGGAVLLAMAVLARRGNRATQATASHDGSSPRTTGARVR
ncbi:MAG: hypothetical protein JO023_19610 [Chloroflexi bacterium]|nr:hypothetical protein [Chloroflexota bacterium]